MRLFFALWPDEGVRAELARWTRALHAACGGRTTRADKLHLTLAFLGEVTSSIPRFVLGRARVRGRDLALLVQECGQAEAGGI